MLVSWFLKSPARAAFARSALVVIISGALGAAATVGLLHNRGWLGGGGNNNNDPLAPAAIDAKFQRLGRSYLPELGRSYATAWTEGAAALEAGQPIGAALKGVGQSWEAGRVKLFDRLVSPQFSAIVPEGQPDAELKPAARAALARAWRGFAAGLRK